MSRMAALILLVVVASACSGSTGTTPSPSAPEVTTVPPSLAGFIPPGAPAEDIRYFNEWPSPNDGLYNTRVASSTISATNVAKLAVAWTVPLTGIGPTGRDFANPVIANGAVYLQDGASNVMAVSYSTVAGDLVFTTTFTGEVAALSRADGSIVWTSKLPAGSNSTLAITGDTLLAGAGLPLSSTQHPALVAYRLG